MINQLECLGKKEELELRKMKFSGKAGGIAWKYSQTIDNLIMIRTLIFIMAILLLYPVLSNYFIHGVFSLDLLIERVIFCAVLIIAGLLYNKYRIFAIILAAIPLVLVVLTNLGKLPAAVTLIILSGIYFQIKAKRLQKELEGYLPENHLIV